MNEPRSTRRFSNQSKAVSLLKQARELLSQRLIKAVLAMGEDLLDDARGDSYAGEIDTLHERLGVRLHQVNVMLAGLTTPEEPDPADDARRQIGGKILRTDPPEITEQHDSSTTTTRIVGRSPDSEAPSAKQPAVDFHPASPRHSVSSYPLFVQDIVRRDLPAAGRRLAEVLGTTLNQGETYSIRFRDQLDRDPAFLAKVHSLRQALQSDRVNEARLLLEECFGLKGLECQAAMQLLKGWL